MACHGFYFYHIRKFQIYAHVKQYCNRKEYKANQKKMHSLEKIGIIGTGMLGRAVATRLLKSG
ncbi:MAG TPA: hypothetical protein VJJ25_00985, partial [Nitrosopumilaceae archaeon]|nr:hypothetical protein [Nitrosopumilaceae archaeon]